MRFEDIPAHEADFYATHRDSNSKNFEYSVESIQIPGEIRQMGYINLKPWSGYNSYHFRTWCGKKQIVLHYTLGYLKGDIGILTQQDYHVSVTFVTGRNGKIYNLFFSGYLAYHLGPGAIGDNYTQSKCTIGIEISNIGGLIRTTRGIENYYRNIFCYVDQDDAYTHQPLSFPAGLKS